MIFNRRYLISLFYLLIISIGFVVLQSIPVELSPSIQLPSITIQYFWGRTSPDVMEREVTRRVEHATSDLKSVERISSITGEGYSTVTVQFSENVNIDFKIIELREKLQEVSEVLPATLGYPIITKLVPEELGGLQTFINYSLSGPLNEYELLELAKRRIQTPLYSIEGISSIELSGVSEPAIQVSFNTKKLGKYGIIFSEVMENIGNNLKHNAIGYINKDDKRISILLPPSIKSLDEIRSMKVDIGSSITQIRLEEIADIKISDFKKTYIRRINGNNSLAILIKKENGYDALTLSKTVQEKIDQIRKVLPPHILLQLESDSTDKLRKELEGLQAQGAFSILVVFSILLIFTRQLRAPLIILATILLSVFLTVICLSALDISLNIITLAALVISFGMVVDNSIIVYEHISFESYIRRKDRIEIIVSNLKKVILPIIGSTITTVGIFIPLIFILPNIRDILAPFAISLSISLLSSVLISLTWIPYAFIWLLPDREYSERKSKNIVKNGIVSRLTLLFVIVKGKLRRYFLVLLIISIGIPLYLIPDIGEESDKSETGNNESFCLKSFYFKNRNYIDPLVGGIGFYFYTKTSFEEPWIWKEYNTISVSIKTPVGTPLEEVEKVTRNFENIAGKYIESIDYYETILSEQYGGYIQYQFKNQFINSPYPYLLRNDAVYLASRTGNTSISVYGYGDGYSSGGSDPWKYYITLSGFSYKELDDLIAELKKTLEKNKRIRNVETTNTNIMFRNDLFQYKYELNNSHIVERGISKNNIIALLQSEINPYNSYGIVEMQKHRYYLVAKTNVEYMYKNQFMEDTRNINGTFYNLSNFGTLSKDPVMNSISRENQEYTRYVTFDYSGTYKSGLEYVKNVIKKFPVPIGYKLEFQKSFYETEKKNTNYILLILMTILTVCMIVAALLENVLDTIYVITAIPFGFIGVMVGVLFHDIPFDRGAITGTLLVIGVSVNNSILLLSGKQQYRKMGIMGVRGSTYILMEKTKSILLTTLTTIGGLVPIIIGGVEGFWYSMSIVVCWGILFSTVLLLIFFKNNDDKYHSYKLLRNWKFT